MSANDGTVEQWVRDVKDWAEHEPPAASNDSLLQVRSRIEETSLGLRQHRARLYSQTDSNSGRSVIRNRMWREQKQLEIYVAQHDTMVQPQEQIGPVSSHCSLSEEGLRGLQAEFNRRRSQLQSHLITVRNKYLQVVRAGLDGSALDLEEGEEQFEEQDLASDVESYSDEEDMDMQGLDNAVGE